MEDIGCNVTVPMYSGGVDFRLWCASMMKSSTILSRADGQEVVVDNKFLRANNPLLLIDFYEQHLRYSTAQ